ncbi:MAG: hypothetical protein ABIL69_09375 [candidate division WOR-3 bacterium]
MAFLISVFILSQIKEEIILRTEGDVLVPVYMPVEGGGSGRYTHSDAWFYPDNSVYCSETTATLYEINIYNAVAGDEFIWRFRHPVYDSITGQMTGEYREGCVGSWRYTGSSWVYEGWDESGGYNYGVWNYPYPNAMIGWGIRPSVWDELYGKLYAWPTYYPGEWQVSIEDKSGLLLDTDPFELIDDIIDVYFYQPIDRDSVSGYTSIMVVALENCWASCSVKVETGGMVVHEFCDTIWHQLLHKVSPTGYDFGYERGKEFKITGIIRDNSGNRMEKMITVYSAPPVIRIVLSPDTVRPWYPDVEPVNLATTRVSVSVKNRAGIPIRNFPVRLDARSVRYSGGHAHNSNRPCGVFPNNQPMITGVTDDYGLFEPNYRAEKFGGKDSIFAYSNMPNVETGDSVELQVMVKDLGLLEIFAGEWYIKTGGTEYHHGHPGWPDDHNHFGTSYTNACIMLIGADYKDSTGYRLRINDMSLPRGGLFDINGNWQPPHSTHRLGRNVDVPFVTAEGTPVNGRIFKKIVIRTYAGDVYTEGNHYHLTFPQLEAR